MCRYRSVQRLYVAQGEQPFCKTVRTLLNLSWKEGRGHNCFWTEGMSKGFIKMSLMVNSFTCWIQRLEYPCDSNCPGIIYIYLVLINRSYIILSEFSRPAKYSFVSIHNSCYFAAHTPLAALFLEVIIVNKNLTNVNCLFNSTLFSKSFLSFRCKAVRE